MFQTASDLGELHVDVVYGTADCLLRKGMLLEAETQLDMLANIKAPDGSMSYFSTLKFILAFHKGIQAEEVKYYQWVLC